MKALDGVGREHEEFRLRLDRTSATSSSRPSTCARTSPRPQAKVLAEAFSHAKINIVGGDGQFFDRFVKAVAVGQSVDGALDHSETLRTVLSDYLQRREGSRPRT